VKLDFTIGNVEFTRINALPMHVDRLSKYLVFVDSNITIPRTKDARGYPVEFFYQLIKYDGIPL
jgi:hypothetical protein